VKKEGADLLLEQKALLVLGKRSDLELYCNKKVKSVNPSDYNFPASLLREYIELTSEVYDLEPEEEFQINLKKCGFCVLMASPTGSSHASQAATGSPPKA
jgi:hypothetical protein